MYGKWIELEEDLMNIIELSPHAHDQYAFGAFTVDTFPMAHIESSIGYRITARDGTSIAYTGDTGLCENAVKLALGADLFICEAALPDAMEVEGHLTPSLAGKIAAEAEVKHLVLTHFYPECETVDLEAECRMAYRGPLTLAQDLMVIDVTRFL